MQDKLYVSANGFTNVMIFMKFCLFGFRRKNYLNLMNIADSTLWPKASTHYEKKILQECANEGFIYLLFFGVLSLCTSIGYIVEAIARKFTHEKTNQPSW